MSTVDKYLQKVYVPKKVDDTLSTAPKPSKVNPETLLPVDIAPTPHSALIEDVLATAVETQKAVKAAIEEIVEANKLDINFSKYAELAAQTFFDMNLLLVDQGARPPEPDPLLGALERDVYRRLVDPRAPFLRDLYRMMTEATLSEFMMKRVWSKSANTPEDSDDRLGRLSLYKEKQYLRSTQRQAKAVSDLRPAPISTWDIRGLAERLLQVATEGEGVARSVEEAIKAAKSLQQLMRMSTISSTTTWEKFSDILANLYFDPISLASARMQREIYYPWFRKSRKQVLDIVSVIHLLPEGGILPGMAEMKDHAEAGLLQMLRNMEEDLLTKERRMIEIEEARLILLMNVYKVSYSKNLTHLLGAVVNCLGSYEQQTKQRKDASTDTSGQSPMKLSLDTLSVTWPEGLSEIISFEPGIHIS